jgi:predicted GNAT family acetyltransferase
MASDHTSSRTPPAVHRNDAAHRYEVLQDGHRAVAMYERTGDVITFTHTIVPPALEGRASGPRSFATPSTMRAPTAGG